jgi:hypothetical protein
MNKKYNNNNYNYNNNTEITANAFGEERDSLLTSVNT